VTLFKRIIPGGKFIFSGFHYLEIKEGEERNCFGLLVVGNSVVFSLENVFIVQDTCETAQQ